MPEFLEILMIVSFGASWPLNVIKSFQSRTAKGKSLAFLLLIFFGYIAGIASKLPPERGKLIITDKQAENPAEARKSLQPGLPF